MQKVIHEESKHAFDKCVENYILDGWEIVVGSFQVQSYAWNPGTLKHDTLVFKKSYFVVLKCLDE